MNFTVVQVPSDTVDKLESVLSPLIAVALEHAQGEITTTDILAQACQGVFQVWTIHEVASMVVYGVAVTQVVEYPRIKAVRVVTLGGRLFDDWARALDDSLCSFARSVGSSRLEAFGRKGLARKLSELAFLPAYTAYMKEIA